MDSIEEDSVDFQIDDFQSTKDDLFLLRYTDMLARRRDLGHLLQTISDSLAEELEKRDSLLMERDFLQLTIQQLLERISPGNVDVKTGKKKKKSVFAKPNISRKMFESI